MGDSISGCSSAEVELGKPNNNNIAKLLAVNNDINNNFFTVAVHFKKNTVTLNGEQCHRVLHGKSCVVILALKKYIV